MPRRRLAPRSIARLVPAALATLALAACGGGDKATGPGGASARGLFSGTVSGHVSRPLAGVAFYGQVTEAGETGFAVGMGSLGADQQTYRDLIVIGREQGGVPAAGTYPLYNSASDADARPEQFVLISTLKLPSGGDLVCAATTGTVTFRAEAGKRLAGAYSTQASCVDMTNPTEELRVTLAGSFDAVESATIPSTARMARQAAARAR
jgi:hypothetical protein